MEKRDLKISGASVSTGGEYKDVRVSGASKITSDITCETMKISGAITMDGNVKAESCKVAGACKVNGSIDSKEIKISGGSKIMGSLNGKEISLSGGIKVGESIKSTYLRLAGEIKVGGDIECEYFNLEGGITSGGVVNCETCELNLATPSEMNELVGAKITVKETNGNVGGLLKTIFGKGTGTLKVNVIEGDEIYLENTTCENVRGQRVTLGPGCKIVNIEYSEELTIDQNSTVENKIER